MFLRGVGRRRGRVVCSWEEGSFFLFTYLRCDDEWTEVDRSFNGEGHCGWGVFGGHVKVGSLVGEVIRVYCD